MLTRVASLVALGLRLLGALDSFPIVVPLFTALFGIGLYQAMRSWKSGDIS